MLPVLLLSSLFVFYLVYKLWQFYRADADLTVLGSQMKPNYFQKKVVWVTGASTGIGEEMCHRLSQMGARLILSSRNEEKLKEVLKSLSHPEEARVLAVDLSDAEAARAAPEKAKEFFGRIDILVNNAGQSMISSLLDTQEHVHRGLLELLLFAPWILTQGVLKGMIDQGFGHIVNINSVLGKMGLGYGSSYSCAKYGVVGLMESLRYEMLNKNVSVTNVFPGLVATPIFAKILNGDGSVTDWSGKMHGTTTMTVQRCVELALIGISNQQEEIWMAIQPKLMEIYMAQYAPSLLRRRRNKALARDLEAVKKEK